MDGKLFAGIGQLIIYICVFYTFFHLILVGILTIVSGIITKKRVSKVLLILLSHILVSLLGSVIYHELISGFFEGVWEVIIFPILLGLSVLLLGYYLFEKYSHKQLGGRGILR